MHYSLGLEGEQGVSISLVFEFFLKTLIVAFRDWIEEDEEELLEHD